MEIGTMSLALSQVNAKCQMLNCRKIILFKCRSILHWRCFFSS